MTNLPLSEEKVRAPASALRGYGPASLAVVATIVVALVFFGPVVAAALVLVWVLLSGTPWRDIGYILPQSWLAGLLLGIVGGVALKVAVKSAVMPLLGAPATNETYQYLTGHPGAAVLFAVYIVVGGGWAEETVYRGWLFERLGKALGETAAAKVVTVAMGAGLFAASHFLDQGWPGVEQAIITGVVLGSLYAVTGSLWIPFWVHVAYDLTAVAMIYFGLETMFAHAIF